MDEYDHENTDYDQYEDEENGSQNHYIQRRKKTPSDLAGAASGGGECCAHVVSPLVFLATFAGLAIATFFLRMAITKKLGKRRRRRSEVMYSKGLMYILTGKV